MAKIIAIDKEGAAKGLLEINDEIIKINGFPFIDLLDLSFCEADAGAVFTVLRDGEELEIEVAKPEYAPFGVELDESAEITPIRCRNKCKFCFVDQLPKGMRETLYVKDDDYRLSFISGNYVTLTNCGESELQRIARLKLSPIYVSVHATDGEVKSYLVANPEGKKTLEKVRFLTENGIDVHTQVVTCPSINDGEVLLRTLNDLYSLGERLKSVAVVPVGLTKHRENLCKLRVFNSDEAAAVIDLIDGFNLKAGVNFAFASDEFYIIAGRALPDYASYGDFAQIENGVGLVREFEHELTERLRQVKGGKRRFGLTMITGVSFAPFLREYLYLIKEKYPFADIEVLEVKNDFFGHEITVSGLLTAGDIIKSAKGKVKKNITIPANMLREFSDCFLDGVTADELAAELVTNVYISAGGGDLIDIIDELSRGFIGRMLSRRRG